uniref:Uncharacterized protein n=1 Tax=Anguilla anguilla TaxID=7936 RepID=A0A0E9RSE2_ANGAN
MCGTHHSAGGSNSAALLKGVGVGMWSGWSESHQIINALVFNVTFTAPADHGYTSSHILYQPH